MKNTFGRGLESLIPKKSEKNQKVSTEKTEPIFYIEIDKIKSNPYQPRKNFDQSGLEALASSIKEYGILQPILVSRIGSESGLVEYQLVAGERRFLAAKMVGLNQVPAIVREPTEQEKLEISLIENVQRLDLNPMEKAEAYKRLQEEFSFTNKDVAEMVGKSRESVINTMRLIELPEEIKRGLREEKITEGHARAILMVKNAQKQKSLFSKVLREGLSVRSTEDSAQKLNIWQAVPKTKISLHLHEERKNLEKKFREIFNVEDIRVLFNVGKPKLVVFFESRKEIENFFKKIKLS